MTVDSKYDTVVTYINDGGTEYPYPFESIGEGANRLYKVEADGTETLLTEGFHYNITFSEYRGDIPYRGTINLVAPLASGSNLRVERKTPITNTLSFSGIMDPQQLEYAFDKICFIEQEIEGHFCDCRGSQLPTTPPSPSEPGAPPPLDECKPYACDALESAFGIGNLTFFEEPDPPNDFFPVDTGLYDFGVPDNVLGDDEYDQGNSGGPQNEGVSAAPFDLCQGIPTWIMRCREAGTVAGFQWRLLDKDTRTTPAVGEFHVASICRTTSIADSAPPEGWICYGGVKANWAGAQDVDEVLNIGTELVYDDEENTFFIRQFARDEGVDDTAGSGAVFFESDDIDFSDSLNVPLRDRFFLVVYDVEMTPGSRVTSRNGINYRLLTCDWDIKTTVIWLNDDGDKRKETFIQQHSSNFSEYIGLPAGFPAPTLDFTGYTPVGNIWPSSNTVAAFHSSAEAIDADALWTAFRRNRTTYNPPDSCNPGTTVSPNIP